jgi:hypothetical protein
MGLKAAVGREDFELYPQLIICHFKFSVLKKCCMQFCIIYLLSVHGKLVCYHNLTPYFTSELAYDSIQK